MSIKYVTFSLILALPFAASSEGGTHTQGVYMCGAEFEETLVWMTGDPPKTFYLQLGDCYHAESRPPSDKEVELHLLNSENIEMKTMKVICDGTTGLSQFCYAKGPACGKKVDARLVVLAGRVRGGGYDKLTSGVTLACALDEGEKEVDPDTSNGAVGKCFLPGWFGYSVDSALPQFQACLRMARADYCSCGISETKPKVMIQAYRPGGVPECSNPKLKKACFEASWNERGPVCYSHKRATELSAMVSSQQKTYNLTEQKKRVKAGSNERLNELKSCLQACIALAPASALGAGGWAPLVCKPTESLGSMLLLNRARHRYDQEDCDRPKEYDPDCPP